MRHARLHKSLEFLIAQARECTGVALEQSPEYAAPMKWLESVISTCAGEMRNAIAIAHGETMKVAMLEKSERDNKRLETLRAQE